MFQERIHPERIEQISDGTDFQYFLCGRQPHSCWKLKDALLAKIQNSLFIPEVPLLHPSLLIFWVYRVLSLKLVTVFIFWLDSLEIFCSESSSFLLIIIILLINAYVWCHGSSIKVELLFILSCTIFYF